MQATRIRWSLASLALVLVVALMSPASFAEERAVGGRVGGGGGAHAGPHQHMDAHFAHNRPYFDRGYSVHRVPPGGIGELRGPDGGRYWYNGGNWYRWRGGAWIVGAAPFGLFVPFLPPFYTTVWWAGVPYYYANDAYYVWDAAQQGYEVVPPPDGIADQGSTQPPPSDQLFIYPKNGQSTEQQAKDRYECSRWATAQTGFDPTASGGGVPPDQAVAKRNDFFRAQVSCLEGRGYSVK